MCIALHLYSVISYNIALDYVYHKDTGTFTRTASVKSWWNVGTDAMPKLV